MKETLKLLRALIENVADALYVADPATGRFLDVNDSACRAMGYTRDQYLALTVFDVATDVDRALFDATVAKARKAGHVRMDSRHRRKDGTVSPVEVSISLVTLDRDYLVVVARDITERKRTDDALHRSREEFIDLFDHAPVGYHEIDGEGRLVRINKTELKMLGYTAEELLGQFVWKIRRRKSGPAGRRWRN